MQIWNKNDCSRNSPYPTWSAAIEAHKSVHKEAYYCYINTSKVTAKFVKFHIIQRREPSLVILATFKKKCKGELFFSIWTFLLISTILTKYVYRNASANIYIYIGELVLLCMLQHTYACDLFSPCNATTFHFLHIMYIYMSPI